MWLYTEEHLQFNSHSEIENQFNLAGGDDEEWKSFFIAVWKKQDNKAKVCMVMQTFDYSCVENARRVNLKKQRQKRENERNNPLHWRNNHLSVSEDEICFNKKKDALKKKN